MLQTAEALRLILAALALGVVLPVMIQLFLTLRQARNTLARVTDQVEPTLQLVHEIAQKTRREQQPGSQLTSIVATIVPAAVAAYGAFRKHQQEEKNESSSLTGLIHGQEPIGPDHAVGRQGREMEKDHE
jgi:UbiD family decarboxylase